MMAIASASSGLAACAERDEGSARRRIWVCADDYGLAPGVNAAICDLVSRGRLNAVSVMTVTPSFGPAQAAALARAAAEGQAALGLHVTFTAPHRPLTPANLPLARGRFLSLGATLAMAMLRRFDVAAVRTEIEAQFAAFSHAFGHPPHFVDGHQHVHLFPQLRDAVLAVTEARASDAWLRQCGRAGAASRVSDPKGLFVGALSKAFRRRAQALGLPTNTAFAGTYAYRPEADFAALFPAFLQGLPDDGLVMCHPGRVDAELVRLDPLTDLREKEYAYLLGDEFPAALAAAGVTLAHAMQPSAVHHVSAMRRT